MIKDNVEIKDEIKIRLKRGDRVVVISGRDRKKEGKVLLVDRKNGRIIVEGVNMVTKHQKPNRTNQSGGIVKKESPIDASNVMFLHKNKPTRIGFKVERKEVNGRMVNVKYRVAKSTGEVID